MKKIYLKKERSSKSGWPSFALVIRTAAMSHRHRFATCACTALLWDRSQVVYGGSTFPPQSSPYLLRLSTCFLSFNLFLYTFFLLFSLLFHSFPFLLIPSRRLVLPHHPERPGGFSLIRGRLPLEILLSYCCESGASNLAFDLSGAYVVVKLDVMRAS